MPSLLDVQKGHEQKIYKKSQSLSSSKQHLKREMKQVPLKEKIPGVKREWIVNGGRKVYSRFGQLLGGVKWQTGKSSSIDFVSLNSPTSPTKQSNENNISAQWQKRSRIRSARVCIYFSMILDFS